MKKFISILLILSSLVTCCTLTVSADEPVVSDEARFPFEDISDNGWYIQDLVFCYANDVVNGMNEYTFAPNAPLTRAQFVTMLAKVGKVDTKEFSCTAFTDVKENHWYYGVVSWAYEVGLVSGTAPDRFSPNATVTRETVSRIMWLYMKDKYPVEISDTVLDKYTDKDKISPWAEDGMKYLVGAGLISGMTETTLAPRNDLTRAQATRILSVFMQQYFYADCDHRFYEPLCTDPIWCMNCGMVKSLPAGHILDAYDCVTGGKCLVCKEEVSPSAYLHDFAPATCDKPRTCTRCSATRGEAKGHSWIAATCTTPKTCSTCKAVEGKAKGHTTQNGICKTCNQEVFKSEAHRIGYYMVKNATPDGKGHYTYDAFFEHQGGDAGYGKVFYDANQFSYTLGYTYMWSSSRSYIDLQVSVIPGTEVYALNTEYYENNKQICSGTVLFKPEDVKSGATDVKLSEYTGSAADKAWFETVTEMTLENCAKSADYLLELLCGSGAEALGFKNINY